MDQQITLYPAQIIDAPQCLLGEGPAWHPQTGSWWWLDIEGRAVYCWFGPGAGSPRVFRFEKRPSKLLHAGAEAWLLALEDEWVLWNFETDTQKHMAALPMPPGHRTNDGSIDPWGAAWIGTMQLEASTATGSLYRMDTSNSVQSMLHPVTIPNGMVWQNEWLYFIDSATHSIRRHRYDAATNKLGKGAPWLQFAPSAGLPDGMCADASGNLWVAFWGGAAVRAYALESGRQTAEIKVDALQVSSCVFGGADGRQMLITTARQGLSETELKQYPNSGNIFLASLPYTGQPPFYWQQNAGAPI